MFWTWFGHIYGNMKKRVNLILESWLLQNWTVMSAKWSKVTLGQKIILSYRLLQFDHTTTCMHLNFLKCKQYIFAVIKKTKRNKISNITYICDCKHSGTSIMSRGNKNYKNLAVLTHALKKTWDKIIPGKMQDICATAPWQIKNGGGYIE